MRITVLLGGPSSEREVSIVSGNAVADALERAGHAVSRRDISPADLSALDEACDVVFPVLHGDFGESGELQAELERRGMPFVGSGSKASAVAIDKVKTKRLWQSHGLPTAAFHVATVEKRLTGPVPMPCVVKSPRSGSSIGVYLCNDAEDAQRRIDETVAADGEALVEEFVSGIELTVGVLFDQTLPPIRIAYPDGFFDYRSKYGSNGAEHRFDTGVDASKLAEIAGAVKRAHDVVGCRDLSRTDVIVREDGSFVLLEINTIPGFTPRSLLPEAAGKAGVGFEELVDRLVTTAAKRGPH